MEVNNIGKQEKCKNIMIDAKEEKTSQ